MSLPDAKHRLTEAEYLGLERRAQNRSEFFDGELFAMAGGTRAHSLIGANLIRALGNQLEKRPCVTYNADLRVKVEATGLITYPDAAVVCGAEIFLDGEQDTLLNPTLLAEVLSDSTEAYDRGTKFSHYRLIPSLRHLLFVSQREPRIECYTRDGDEWILSEVSGTDSALRLPALEIDLPLSQVFARVEFSSRPAPLRPDRPVR